MKKLLSSLLALALGLSLAVLPASALELDQARELLAVHYVDGVPPEVLELPSLDAILKAIDDPYTFYMTPEQYDAFNQSVNGQTVVGIGATVETAYNGGYRVMSVLPDSPAQEAGIRPGDIITAADGTAMSPEVDPRIPVSGQEGTSVTLTINRNGQTLELTLTRRAVPIPIVTYEQRDGAGVIDCISFGSTTASSVQEAILSMDGDTSVWIMDLRSNPGGDSRSTAASVSLFTGGGIMLYFRDGAGHYNYTYTLPDFPDMTDKPVIVLTSEHSASGSELFAGGIRTYDAGIALGQRTFGKGTAQIVFEERNCPYMKNGEAMKITAYRFFAPDGATNHVTGVLPTLLISPENTDKAAMLLTHPEPRRLDGYWKLVLSGQTFYLKSSDAREEENQAAFTELLEALPLSAALYKGSGAATWTLVSPEQAASELGLSFTPRTFTDTEDSQFTREIDILATYHILKGFGDGTFRPGETISRAQFCAMAASALGLPASAGKPGRFSDVPDSAWYAGAVNAMANMGFVSGSGGTFRPGQAITYQEMTSILSRVAAWVSMDGYNLDGLLLTPEEVEKYSDFAPWAQAPARNLDELNALAGDLAPTDPGTREIAAAMLCRLMERTHLIWN
jgi:C-terminal peptidase prc